MTTTNGKVFTKAQTDNGQLVIEAVKYGNNELLRELLSSGDSVHYLDYCDERGFTALHFAATLNDPTCLNLLLAAGGTYSISSIIPMYLKNKFHFFN